MLGKVRVNRGTSVCCNVYRLEHHLYRGLKGGSTVRLRGKRRKSMKRAIESAQRCIALDESLPVAHGALSAVY